jgi:hypothetical protein
LGLGAVRCLLHRDSSPDLRVREIGGADIRFDGRGARRCHGSILTAYRF